MLADVFSSLSEVLQDSLMNLGKSFSNLFVPLVGLVVLLAVGYLVGWILKKIVIKLIESLRLDEWLEEQNLSAAIGGKAISSIIGSLVKWSIIVLFLAQGVKNFEATVLYLPLEAIVFTWIPNLIIAVIIGVVGLIFGRYVRNLIEVSMTRFRKIIGFGVEILIIYMAMVIALQQIGIPTQILIEAFRIGFGGFVLAIVIVVGMAFGFASVDDAKRILNELKKSKPK